MAVKSQAKRLVTYRATKCPQCGSVLSRVKAAGYSDYDEHRIRYRRCIDCNWTYTTVEVPVPDETTFYRLEPHHREKRRLQEREKYGYTRVYPNKRVESDRVEVKVTVKPWVRDER